MEEEKKNNYFVELSLIDVKEHVESKNGLSYLSWAWAWAAIKTKYPDAFYTIYENQLPEKDGGYCVNYFTDGKTCWVKTGVTVNGIEHIEELPVMDYKNKSIAYDMVTSMDVNKAIQRSLTKAVARHGLGLYIYAGEDLPTLPYEDLSEDGPKMPLTDLQRKVGDLVKTLRLKEGGMDKYNAIVKEVVPSGDFKVNKATEKDYDQVLEIYKRLKEVK